MPNPNNSCNSTHPSRHSYVSYMNLLKKWLVLSKVNLVSIKWSKHNKETVLPGLPKYQLFYGVTSANQKEKYHFKLRAVRSKGTVFPINAPTNGFFPLGEYH